MGQRNYGIIISYANVILHAVIGIIYVPLLLSYIGKSEYGIYQLIGSLIAYFGIMDFGLTTVVVRYYAKYKALNDKIGMENILAISTRAFSVITFFLLLIGAGLYYEFDSIFGQSMSIVELQSAKKVLLLLIINIVVTISTMTYQAVIMANQRYIFLKGLETVQLVIQPILMICILEQYPSAFSVALVQTILNVLLVLMRIYYSYNKLKIKIKFHYWNKELYLHIRKLAVTTFLVAIVNQVYFKTGQIILGIVDGTTAVAIFSISTIIYMNYMALSAAICGVYLPHVTALIAKKTKMNIISNLFIKIGSLQYLVLFLALTIFIFWGDEFIYFWAGDGFQEAYYITLLIIVPFTIDLIQNVGLCILQAMNRYDIRARVYTVMGVANILLSIFLAKMYGGIGCAIAIGLSMALGNGVWMNYYYSKEIKLKIKFFWVYIYNLTFRLFPFVFLCFCMNELVIKDYVKSSIECLIGTIFSYIIIYSLVVYNRCISSHNKRKIKLFLGKRGFFNV